MKEKIPAITTVFGNIGIKTMLFHIYFIRIKKYYFNKKDIGKVEFKFIRIAKFSYAFPHLLADAECNSCLGSGTYELNVQIMT